MLDRSGCTVHSSFFLVPIIAVFTKYDKLYSRAEEGLIESGCEDEEYISQLAKEAVDEALQKNCIDPLKRCVGGKLPYIAVSSELRRIVIIHRT